MPPHALTLTAAEMRAALQASDGYHVPQRTWVAWSDIIPATIRHTRGFEGNLYTLSDLARARLLVQLRQGGLTMQRCRAIFAYLDAELREVLTPRTTASLVVDQRRAYVVRPGQPDIEVPSGQLRLRLADAWRDTEKFARAAKRAA